jgi:hypothetical protein
MMGSYEDDKDLSRFINGEECFIQLNVYYRITINRKRGIFSNVASQKICVALFSGP